LRSRVNHVVGFLGDGINDAPSIHTADVSVATAVDAAKDAADIILLECDLGVLHAASSKVGAFGNVMKYLLMGTSSNFGNMFSMGRVRFKRRLMRRLLVMGPALPAARRVTPASEVARARSDDDGGHDHGHGSRDSEVRSHHHGLIPKRGWIAHVKEAQVYRRCERRSGPAGRMTSNRVRRKSARRSKRRFGISV
jgi:hypothetical protein